METQCVLVSLDEPQPHHTTTVLRPFFQNHLGEPVPEEKLVDFMVQGKINRGRHTDHPAGHHSIRTKQCPPPNSGKTIYWIIMLTPRQIWKLDTIFNFIHKSMCTAVTSYVFILYLTTDRIANPGKVTSAIMQWLTSTSRCLRLETGKCPGFNMG